MVEQKKTNPAVELLCSLFMSNGKKGIFDIPGDMFRQWAENKSIQPVNATECIYWEFLHEEVVANYCEDFFFDDPDFETQVSDFRQKIIRQIIYSVNYDWLSTEEETFDYITFDDVSEFIQLVSKNRIWSDGEITKMRPILREYVMGARAHVDGSDKIEEDDEVELTEDEVEEAEKAARRKCIDPNYVDYVDAINLKKLKLLLRDNLWRPFELFWWQKDAVTMLKRFNFIAASRRSWKTYAGAYLAARQIYIPNQIIIYVVPILRVQAKVSWRYLTAMLKHNPMISFNKSDRTITNRQNWSEIQFLSGERDTSVRAPSANLLIFDEAAFLTEELYETASALVRTTNWIVYAITTVNPKVPKNWFYYRLVKGELAKYEKDSQRMGMRVTLHNNPFIPDGEKQAIIDDGKQNIHMFNCEWMAEFLESDAFELSKFWIIDNAPLKYMINGVWEVEIRAEALEKDGPYYKFLLNYDCAKLSDKPWVSVIGLKHDWGAEIVMSQYLNMFDYYDQVKLLLELRKLLGEAKTVVLLDYGWPWIVVEEIFRRTYWISVIKLQKVWGTWYNRDWGIHRVGSELMLWKMKSSVSRWMIRWFSFMSWLRLEFETFDESGTRKFWHHYDILQSIMYWNAYLDKIGIMTPKDKDKSEDRDKRVVGSMPEGFAQAFWGLASKRWEYDRFSNWGY